MPGQWWDGINIMGFLLFLGQKWLHFYDWHGIKSSCSTLPACAGFKLQAHFEKEKIVCEHEKYGVMLDEHGVLKD